MDGIQFCSSNPRGGISVYFRQLINRSQSDFDVNLIIPQPSKLPISEFPDHIVNTYHKRLLEKYRSPLSIESGVLHSSYYRVSRNPSVTNIVTVYDFSYELFCSGARKYIHVLQKLLAFNYGTSFICISENTRKDLLRLYPFISHKSVHVIPLAANDSFYPLSNNLFSSLSFPYILFVGNRSDYKNFTLAVKTLSVLPDIHLYCVGGGKFSKYELSIMDSLIPGRYKGFGHVSDQTLNNLYNSALCLLYPSRYEGFGIPPLEAISSGCPVVAFPVASIPEVLGDAGIYAQEPHPDHIAELIQYYCFGERRSQLVDKGFDQSSCFSWEATYDLTKQIYQSYL